MRSRSSFSRHVVQACAVFLLMARFSLPSRSSAGCFPLRLLLLPFVRLLPAPPHAMAFLGIQARVVGDVHRWHNDGAFGKLGNRRTGKTMPIRPAGGASLSALVAGGCR